MSETREQIIERMAQAAYEQHPVRMGGLNHAEGTVYSFDDALNHRGVDLLLADVGAALPVAVKAVTDRVRELHYAAYCDAERTPICPDCHGKAGTHPCGCWSDTDTEPVCAVCREGWKFLPVPYPCPTVHLLDQLEAELGADS